jgi:hypothetical protein
MSYALLESAEMLFCLWIASELFTGIFISQILPKVIAWAVCLSAFLNIFSTGYLAQAAKNLNRFLCLCLHKNLLLL